MSNTFALLSPHPSTPPDPAVTHAQTTLVTSGDLVFDSVQGDDLPVGGDVLFSPGAHTWHEVPVSLTTHVVPPAGPGRAGTHVVVGDHMAPSHVGEGSPKGDSSSPALGVDRQLLAVVTPKSKGGRVVADRLARSDKSISRVPHESLSPSVQVGVTPDVSVVPRVVEHPQPASSGWKSILPADPAVSRAHAQLHTATPALPLPPQIPPPPTQFYTLTADTYKAVTDITHAKYTVDVNGLPMSNVPGHVNITRTSTLQSALSVDFA